MPKRVLGCNLMGLPLLALAMPAAAVSVPAPPPQTIIWQDLPLPPTAPSDQAGSCTAAVDPRGTGCMSRGPMAMRGGDFLPDGRHVIAAIKFAGAPQGSRAAGMQVVLIKTDGRHFANGQAWKCLTCGTPGMPGAEADFSYPPAFPTGNHVLVGSHIYDCGGLSLTDEACTPDRAVHPIHWQTGSDADAPSRPLRELRIHPDGVHIGFNGMFVRDGSVSQLGYVARLRFNAAKASS